MSENYIYVKELIVVFCLYLRASGVHYLRIESLIFAKAVK